MSEQMLRKRTRRLKNNLLGKTIGCWTVIRYLGRVGQSTKYLWLCRCKCGAESEVEGSSLHPSKRPHRACRKCHPKTSRPEYRTWCRIKARCNTPSATYYGGRGIKVCERWNEFENFYADMGPRPSPKYSIDRIDANGNYEPGNCRWATQKEQGNNKRSTRFITMNEKTQCILDWAKELGLKHQTILVRLKLGWDDAAALAPVIPRKKMTACS